MSNRKVVMVTGIANSWGHAFAQKMISEENNLDQQKYSVIGLDSIPPEEEIRGLDFIQADLRNSHMVELIRTEKVDIVCHLTFPDSIQSTSSSFDINILGTMKLFGACAEAGVQKIILKSSMAVYGARPDNPSFISEQNSLNGSRTNQYTRYLVEVETFCNSFKKQVPEMTITVLRFANIIGTKADTPISRLLKEELVPKLMGFDPRMQVIHENDVLDALLYVTKNDMPGIFNIAAEGVLPISKIIALTGKIPLPIFHPFAYWGKRFFGNANNQLLKYWPIEPDYLRYSWVGDLAKMRQELGFVPKFTAEEALREFTREQQLRRFTPETLDLEYDETSLKNTIEKRSKGKEVDLSRVDLQAEEN